MNIFHRIPSFLCSALSVLVNPLVQLINQTEKRPLFPWTIIFFSQKYNGESKYFTLCIKSTKASNFSVFLISRMHLFYKLSTDSDAFFCTTSSRKILFFCGKTSRGLTPCGILTYKIGFTPACFCFEIFWQISVTFSSMTDF